MTDNLNVVCVITSKDFFRMVLRECIISDTAEFVIVREFARDFIRALDTTHPIKRTIKEMFL